MPSLYAHRGARATHPENTLVAFAAGVAAGAQGLEFDVHRSLDGEVVVCHDPTVDRTTDGTGRIETMPWAQLRQLDAGAQWRQDPDADQANGGRRHGPTPFAGQGIGLPRLHEVLERFPDRPLTVEFKSVAVAAPALAVLRRMGVRDRVLVGSFLTAALAEARGAGFRTTASQGELLRLLPAALAGVRVRDLPFDVVAIPPRWHGMPVPVRALLRSLGRPVHVWTVNEVGQARGFAAMGVEAILSDAPARLMAADPPIAFRDRTG